MCRRAGFAFIFTLRCSLVLFCNTYAIVSLLVLFGSLGFARAINVWRVAKLHSGQRPREDVLITRAVPS